MRIPQQVYLHVFRILLQFFLVFDRGFKSEALDFCLMHKE